MMRALVERGGTGDLAAVKLIVHLLTQSPHVEAEAPNEGLPGETMLEAFLSQHGGDPVVKNFVDALLSFQPRAVTESDS
jgi:hypothetical protein